MICAAADAADASSALVVVGKRDIDLSCAQHNLTLTTFFEKYHFNILFKSIVKQRWFQ